MDHNAKIFVAGGVQFFGCSGAAAGATAGPMATQVPSTATDANLANVPIDFTFRRWTEVMPGKGRDRRSQTLNTTEFCINSAHSSACSAACESRCQSIIARACAACPARSGR